jgi:hypothetical protein
MLKAIAARKRVTQAQDTQDVAKVGISSTSNTPLTDLRAELDCRRIKGDYRCQMSK